MSKANNAKIETDKASVIEKVEIAVMGSFDENGKINIATLKSNLKQTEGLTEADSITALPATVKVDDYDVTIDKKGKVTLGKIEEEPIYARLYTKNGTEEQVLVFASNESVIPDYAGELTLYSDLGNIDKKYETIEDLYKILGYKEILESMDLEQYNEEEKQEILTAVNYCKWLINKDNLVEVRILNEICPNSILLWFSYSPIEKIIGIENLNTSNVANMEGLFSGCSNLTELNLSNFDTLNVTYMGNMFMNCRNLKQLDVSKFNTSCVTGMGGVSGVVLV